MPATVGIAPTGVGKAEIGTEEIVVPDTVEELLGGTDTKRDVPWVVIVWDDPINLMEYVVHVFQKLFGFPAREGAQAHAAGAQRGQGGRGERDARAVRGRRRPAARARALGDDAARHVSNVVSKRRKRASPTTTTCASPGAVRPSLLRLHEREVQVLQWVFADLERLLDEGAGSDAVTQRLFPRAYLDPTEESAESEWQSLVHGDLVETRRSALGVVVLGLDAASETAGRSGMREVALDEARAEQWLGVLNDARLAFGTALGVTADTDLDALEPDDPRRGVRRLRLAHASRRGAARRVVGAADDLDRRRLNARSGRGSGR